MKILVYSTRKSRRLIMEEQLATDKRNKYLELLNLEMSLDFESLTQKQQIKHYGTTNFNHISLN